MKEKIGAYCTIRFNDAGDEVSGCYFSLEDYDEVTQVTSSGVSDENVFFYADSPEQIVAMVAQNNRYGDFTILSIDDWVEVND
jgi:hypothetical protein